MRGLATSIIGRTPNFHDLRDPSSGPSGHLLPQGEKGSSLHRSPTGHAWHKAEHDVEPYHVVVVALCPGRQTSSRFSTIVTSESIAITKIARISMPENTPVTSKTLSASWIL